MARFMLLLALTCASLGEGNAIKTAGCIGGADGTCKGAEDSSSLLQSRLKYDEENVTLAESDEEVNDSIAYDQEEEEEEVEDENDQEDIIMEEDKSDQEDDEEAVEKAGGENFAMDESDAEEDYEDESEDDAAGRRRRRASSNSRTRKGNKGFDMSRAWARSNEPMYKACDSCGFQGMADITAWKNCVRATRTAHRRRIMLSDGRRRRGTCVHPNSDGTFQEKDRGWCDCLHRAFQYCTVTDKKDMMVCVKGDETRPAACGCSHMCDDFKKELGCASASLLSASPGGQLTDMSVENDSTSLDEVLTDKRTCG